MTGHNWCATLIKLAENRVLNLVTSYIPHGTTQDGTRTIVEVNEYLDQYKIPYVWGEILTAPQTISRSDRCGRGATT